MNAAGSRSAALDKLEEFRVVILEHILKTAIMPDHEAVVHWQKEIHAFQARLIRYHKSKQGKPNYTEKILWEYLWEDQLDELPMGFIDEYQLKKVVLNFDDIKAKLQAFIAGILT